MSRVRAYRVRRRVPPQDAACAEPLPLLHAAPPWPGSCVSVRFPLSRRPVFVSFRWRVPDVAFGPHLTEADRGSDEQPVARRVQSLAPAAPVVWPGASDFTSLCPAAMELTLVPVAVGRATPVGTLGPAPSGRHPARSERRADVRRRSSVRSELPWPSVPAGKGLPAFAASAQLTSRSSRQRALVAGRLGGPRRRATPLGCSSLSPLWPGAGRWLRTWP